VSVAETGPHVGRTPALPRWLTQHGLALLSFGALIVLWQVLVTVLRVPAFLLPPPSLIVTRTLDWGPNLLVHVFTTLYEVVAGFALAVVIAVPLAVLVATAPGLRNTIYPLLVSSQSVPKVAIAPLILLWVGYGELPKVIIAALVAFFPIVVDTAQGLQLVPRDLLDLANSLTNDRRRIFFKIRFPAALPYFFAASSWARTRDSAT
jgi:NitT/TauT family transport system permease protein